MRPSRTRRPLRAFGAGLLTLLAAACAGAPTPADGSPDELVYVDTDGDGIADTAVAAAAFADSDGDGLPDQRARGAAFVDTDGDGLPDRRVIDPDAVLVDTDGDGIPDTRRR